MYTPSFFSLTRRGDSPSKTLFTWQQNISSSFILFILLFLIFESSLARCCVGVHIILILWLVWSATTKHEKATQRASESTREYVWLDLSVLYSSCEYIPSKSSDPTSKLLLFLPTISTESKTHTKRRRLSVHAALYKYSVRDDVWPTIGSRHPRNTSRLQPPINVIHVRYILFFIYFYFFDLFSLYLHSLIPRQQRTYARTYSHHTVSFLDTTILHAHLWRWGPQKASRHKGRERWRPLCHPICKTNRTSPSFIFTTYKWNGILYFLIRMNFLFSFSRKTNKQNEIDREKW